MSGPVKASDVETASDKTEDQLAREVARRAVRARQARREALRATGGLAPGSDGLASRLDDRLRKIQMQTSQRYRAQKAVNERLNPREQPDG